MFVCKGTKVEVSQSDDDDSEDDTEETHIEKMSAAHKLGLAKVESVKEWLSHVLKPQDNGSAFSFVSLFSFLHITYLQSLLSMLMLCQILRKNLLK